MTLSTRFFRARMDTFFDEANEALTTFALSQYQEAAEEVAEEWSRRVRASGRAPGKGMDNISGRVTQPKRGGFFLRVGWLDNPPMAEDGKTSWFVYQDIGYDPFGMIAKGYNASRVPGLLLQVDARQNLAVKVRDANKRIAGRVSRAAAKQRRG